MGGKEERGLACDGREQVDRGNLVFFSLEFVCGQESCAQADRITQGTLQSWRKYDHNLGSISPEIEDVFCTSYSQSMATTWQHVQMTWSSLAQLCPLQSPY